MTATETEPSRHKCLIYDGHPSEQLPVVIPLIIDSLARNERCLYLGDNDTVAMVSAALAHEGVEVDRYVASKALVMSSERDVSTPFDPQAMVSMLVTMIDEALRDGFTGLCATGDMRWELGGDASFSRLLEYEALLEQVFRTKPLRGICQYHRSSVPASALHDALRAHRSLYVGSSLNKDNIFYVPPELLLKQREEDTGVGTWMYQQLSRIMDAERSRDRALVALADVNKDLERRVQQRTESLEHANQELEAFSYSVSHDLRAPVRHIKGFTEILLEDFAGSLGDDGATWVNKVRESADRMNGMIEGMLTLSRVTRAPLEIHRVDLTAIADAVAATLREHEPDRHVEWIIERDLKAYADTGLMNAVIENLFSNAWKFTSHREGARIEFRAGDVRDGHRLFRVIDNGAGFEQSAAAKLFGVFQRLHRQDQFSGTGVGLATVDRIIRRHGGKIWAEGAVNAGATFHFTLPLHPTAGD